MNFQFDSLRFDTIPDEEFRLTFRPAERQNVHLLWMEGKKAKHQWTAEIDDVSKYGPVGVPKEALFDFLRSALKERDRDETVLVVAEKGPAGPLATISCTVDQCSKTATLELTVRFTDVWSNVYKFPLQPREMSKAEILAAKLRDAEEQIVQLKQELGRMNSRPMMLVKGKVWVDKYDGPSLMWDPAEVLLGSNNEHLDVNAGSITILRGGVYRLTFDVTQLPILPCGHPPAVEKGHFSLLLTTDRFKCERINKWILSSTSLTINRVMSPGWIITVSLRGGNCPSCHQTMVAYQGLPLPSITLEFLG